MGICVMDKPLESPYFRPLSTHPFWEVEILPALKFLATGTYSTEKAMEFLAIFNNRFCWKRRTFHWQRLKRENDYWAVKSLYRENLPTICKMFAQALLQLQPETPIRLVAANKPGTFNYRKTDFIYLLLLMFFSLVPRQSYDENKYYEDKFNNSNNFAHVLSHNQFKARCIVDYLLQAIKDLTEGKPDEQLTIIREVAPTFDKVFDLKRDVLLSKLELESNQRSLEEFNGEIKVDFANRFIGGGCLTDGCVQEEIMFAVRPELYATTLLCQKMEDHEALAFIGFRRYFNHTGYGDNTKFDGPSKAEYRLNQDGQAEEYITAIDAIKFKKGSGEQYEKRFIDREILKAYVGFRALGKEVKGRIVTGGWGCGVYNGDIQAKLLIQWIAASMAGRDVVFCPFGKKNLLEQHALLERLSNKTVLEVYITLLRACENKRQYRNESLFTLAVKKPASKF